MGRENVHNKPRKRRCLVCEFVDKCGGWGGCLFKICICWSSLEDQRVGMKDLHILTKEPERERHYAGVVLSWH